MMFFYQSQGEVVMQRKKTKHNIVFRFGSNLHFKVDGGKGWIAYDRRAFIIDFYLKKDDESLRNPSTLWCKK